MRRLIAALQIITFVAVIFVGFEMTSLDLDNGQSLIQSSGDHHDDRTPIESLVYLPESDTKEKESLLKVENINFKSHSAHSVSSTQPHTVATFFCDPVLKQISTTVIRS